MQNEPEHPQLVKFTKKKVIVKDYDFYKGKDNLWNKFPHMDNKIYSQFHKINQDKQEMITSKLEQEKGEKKYMEQLRLRMIGNKKIEDKSRYFQRIEERELIQSESNQSIGNLGSFRYAGGRDALDELIAKKTDATRISRLNDNSWNFLQGLSKKYINQYLTPAVLKGEEYRINVIKNALEQDQYEEEYYQQRQSQIIQEIKEDLASRREQNSKVMKQLGIISKKNDYSQSVPTSEKKAYSPNIFLTSTKKDSPKPSRDSISTLPMNSEFQSNDEFSEYNDFNNKHIFTKKTLGTVPDINRLSIPKKASIKTFDQAQTELRGSLIQVFDKSTFYPENDFFKIVVNKSQMCKEALEDIKPSARRTGPRNQSLPPMTESSNIMESPQLSTRNNVKIMLNLTEESPVYEINSTPIGSGPSNNKKDILDEISAFEKRISQNPKKVGYSRMDLQKSYKNPLLGSQKKLDKPEKEL